MKRFFLLMILILFTLSCEKGEHTVKIPKFLVNRAVEKKFPLEKNIVLARANLSNPKVSFADNRLIMDLDFKISAIGENTEGKMKVSSSVLYDSDKREVYLDNLSIDEIVNKDGSKVEKTKMYNIFNELLSNYMARKPVYTMEEKYKNYDIINIKIEKSGFYVVVNGK